MPRMVVTGAGRGIGFGLAQRAIAAGWDVIGTVRSEADAQRCRAELGGRFQPFILDIADFEAVKHFGSDLDQPVDVLVNNAGIMGPQRQSVLDMDFAAFQQVLAVNTLAPLAVTQALLPQLKRSASPRVLVISSFMGSMSQAKANSLAYRASKAAVNKVSQAMATELRAFGIAVAAVHPGWVRTDMGGSGADIAIGDSVEGLFAIATGLTLGNSGQFFNYDGSRLEW